jgi:hypothetical protein
MNLLRVIVVVLLLGLIGLFGCGGPDWSLIDLSRPMEPRLTQFGFALPYPIWAAPIEMSERVYSAITPLTAERLIPIILQIDSTGLVSGMAPLVPTDSETIDRYGPFLERYRFEPGQINGAISPMALLVEIQTNSFSTQPIVRFPVGPNRVIRRYDHYLRALKVLGVEVPAIESFPAYNYEFKPGSSRGEYPIKLFRVDLDSLGEVLAIESVRETSPDFSDQIMSAINWGEYTPLRIDGRAIESSSYLVLSLYPTIKYPTLPTYRGVGDQTLWGQVRVMLVPDTTGLILPAAPLRDWSGLVVDSFYQGMTPDLVSGRATIGVTGRCRIRKIAPDFFRAGHLLHQRANGVKFYPARRLDGSPLAFDGLVYLRYIDKARVRIWFDWLGELDPGPPLQVAEPQ